MKNRSSRLRTAALGRTCTLAALVAGALAFGSAAKAQVCAGYSITSGPGTFVPGTNDIGNHCDDCVTSIALPFNVNFYGTAYSSANISSNGTLQFVSSNTTYANVCWPATGIQTGFGPTIFPLWDDQYTSDAAGGQGIFTDLSGSPGSQVFVVEWRTVYCCGTGTPINDFEVKFYENQSYIDIVYSSTMADRSSATIGVQDGAGQFVQYSCNVPAAAPGSALRINCLSASTAGACCNPTAGTCAIANQADCTPAANFQGIGTSCPGTCPGQGACCDVAAGTCTLRGATGCTSPLVFQSVGSTCTVNPCVGACCTPSTGACTLTGTTACASPSVFQSTGTSCTPNPCPQPPAPSNDNCSDVVTANAPIIPPAGGTVNGTTAAATTDGACSCGSSGYRDVYYLFTPATSGSYTINLCQTTPSYDTVLSVHSGCPADTSTQIAGGCNDDSCGLLSSVTANSLVAGTQYIIRVSDYSSAFVGGPFVLNVAFNVSGACCNAANGACTVSITGAAGCPANSNYQGDNSACPSGNLCPGLGTCCSPAGNCSVQYSGSCASGLTSNSATSCSPTLCSQSAGTICEGFESGLPSTWTTSSTGAGNPWAPDSTQVYAGSSSIFTNDVASVSSQFLQLPAVTAGSGGSVIIDFFSYFQTEATFDGFVVEYSTDAGNTWTDVAVGGSWILNPYNQAAISVNFNSPIAGRPAFSGAATTWTEHIASVPASAGTQVIFRFQMASDSSVSSTGVWLDNICVSGTQVQGASGVCCRGATCSTTVAQGSCTGGGTAGATFVSSASNCNSAGSTTTPCCYANYNKVNGITVQDIFDFLNDWFAGSPYARTGGNGAAGALAVQNIFDFLNAWFAGGCS